MCLQQARVRPRQSILRQEANRLEQRGAYLVIQIFGRQLPLPRLQQPFAHRRRKFGHMSDGKSLVGQHERSEEHTSELQSHLNLVCRLLLEKKKETPHSVCVSPNPTVQVRSSRT